MKEISQRLARFLPCLLGLLLVLPFSLQAGPPFVTDDPEPVDYRHWEVYLASQLYHSTGSWSGTAPQVEVNYGVLPDLQLHLITPDAFSTSTTSPTAFGLGNVELGTKYRFVHQTDYIPEIAIFPLLELPTANFSRGLGNDHPQVYLPIWMQKDFGKWTTYGGGGYWVNPGVGNQNYEFFGWLLQRQITDHFALGTEIFHQTAQTQFGDGSTYFNTGATWDVSDLTHVLFSVGHSIDGPVGYQAYLAVQFTFGPK